MACRTHEEIAEKISRSIASCAPLVYPESVPCLPNMPTYEEMYVSLISPIMTILQFSFVGGTGGDQPIGAGLNMSRLLTPLGKSLYI